MYRRRFLERAGLAGVGIGSAIALSGCVDEWDGAITGGGGGDANATDGDGEDDGYDVGMTADGYVPDDLTVTVGDTVVWENTSTRIHTVTAYEGGIPEDAEYFASGGFDDEETARDEWHDDFGGDLRNGEQFSHTFDVPGRYDYVCIPHEFGGMYATVIVEEP
ncbi:plastocyanin [Halorubrum alkaliphilum]|uniref:Plastocyanin n=1 Tax=Halorubrum alkaliphilum TaxID=261290 RepID=A0A8T4GB81_9EURY|nr:plastocyanin/azurin family copper-binding protein [Halorubrum alkaliphilum]MBP1921356.1 plastocyanin [Halorubrum alkaliphilum]